MKCILILSSIAVFSSQLYSQSVITGKVKDSLTNEPLAWAQVKALTEEAGTITNIDGAFHLEVSSLPLELEVNYLGYQTDTIEVTSTSYLEISLNELSQILEEVTIAGEKQSAFELLQESVQKIGINYPQTHFNSKAFFRETGKINFYHLQKGDEVFPKSSSAKISEALLNVYHHNYGKKGLKKTSDFELINGRNIELQETLNSKVDTAVKNMIEQMKLKGGVDDIKKVSIRDLHKSDIFNNNKFYSYSIKEIVNLGNNKAYKIEITPKEGIKELLYQGHVLVDVSSLSILRVQMAYSPKHVEHAFRIKLLGVEARDKKHNFIVIYQNNNGKVVPIYAEENNSTEFFINRTKSKVEISMECELEVKKEILYSKFSFNNVKEIPKNKLFKKRDQISQKFTKKYAPNYWNEYTILPIDESILKVYQVSK